MEMTKEEARRLSGDIDPYLDTLFSIAKYYKAGDDILFFEIGVRRANSTKTILRGLNNRLGTGKLYSVDKDDREGRVVDNELKQHWVFTHGRSEKIPWDKEIDVLFIDGDHTYEGVKADYEKYEPFVKDGGIILMHDITHRHFGVKDFWKEIIYPKVNLPLNGVGFGIISKIVK